MPDSGAGQEPSQNGSGADGGDKAYNKLMQAHGRTVTRAEAAERKAAELEARLADREAELTGYQAMGQAPDDGEQIIDPDDDGAAEASDDGAGGVTDDDSIGFPSFELPTPKSHNESRTRGAIRPAPQVDIGGTIGFPR